MDLATLQRMHPEWNLVDFKVAPNGGIWALGRDGGVFALDATGGSTGIPAPFLGSYHTELAKYGRQGETNTFQRIDVTPTGGYQLVSTNQQVYGQGGEFSPPVVAPPSAAPPTSTAGTTQATGDAMNAPAPASAEAAIHAVLDPIGLGSLAGEALAALHGTPGADAAWISTVWLPQQQTYRDMFPEIGQAQQRAAQDPSKGTYIPTPADIINYRQQANEYVQQGLIPPEFATKENLGKLIVGGVSVDELRGRIENGWAKLVQAPDDLAAFLDYHPGLDLQHAVGALLDPTLGEAAAAAAIGQAQIGGAARRSGFGPISQTQAASLLQAGQGSEAQFAQAALESGLTRELVGETDDLTQATQVSAIGQNADALAALNRRRQSRQALFQGGGGAAATGGGRTGLG